MTFCIPFVTALMQPPSAGGGASLPCTSIQHVTGTVSASSASVDVTISTVDTTVSTLMWGGQGGNATDDIRAHALVRAELINSTTVRFTRGSSASAGSIVCKVSIVEWSSDWVDTIQRGTIALTNPATSNTATITGVDTARSYVSFLGASSSNTASAVSNLAIPLVVLTNGTTVTASVNTAETSTNTVTVSYEVVQLKAVKVRSVQYAQFSGTATSATENVTISSVAVGDCMVIQNGQTSANANAGRCFTAELTSSTNVAFTRGQTTSTVQSAGVTVVELISTFAAVQNISATGYATSATSVDQSITALNTADSFLTYQGISTGAATAYNVAISSVDYKDTDEVTFRRGPTTSLTTPTLKARSHTFVT